MQLWWRRLVMMMMSCLLAHVTSSSLQDAKLNINRSVVSLTLAMFLQFDCIDPTCRLRAKTKFLVSRNKYQYLSSWQIHFVRRILALPPPHRNLRDKQRCFYERKFQEIFPSASIHLFGSSVNGFGVKGCDMDVFLSIPGLGEPKERDKVRAYVLCGVKRLITK